MMNRLPNLDMTIHYDDYPVEKITAPILLVHAEDDPMAKFEEVKTFIERIGPQMAIFKTGGQFITGHEKQISPAMTDFIEEINGM